MKGKTNAAPNVPIITGTKTMVAIPKFSDSYETGIPLEHETLSIGGVTYYGTRVGYGTFLDCRDSLSFQYDADCASGAQYIIFRGTARQIVQLNGSGTYSLIPEFLYAQTASVLLASTVTFPTVLDLNRVIRFYTGTIETPAADGQIVIDTDIPGSVIGFNLPSAPSNPGEGDIYFSSRAEGSLLGACQASNDFLLQIGNAYQFTNGAWHKKNAWLSEKGMWRKTSHVWNGRYYATNNSLDGNVVQRVEVLQSTLNISASTYENISIESTASTTTTYAYFDIPLTKEMLSGFSSFSFRVLGGATSSSNVNRIGLVGSIGETSITDWLAFAAIGTRDATEKTFALPSNLPDKVYLAMSVYRRDYWNVSELRFI